MSKINNTLYIAFRITEDDAERDIFPTFPEGGMADDGDFGALIHGALDAHVVADLDTLESGDDIFGGDEGALSVATDPTVKAFTIAAYTDSECVNGLASNMVFFVLPSSVGNRYDGAVCFDGYYYIFQHIGTLNHVVEHSEDDKTALDVERWVNDVREAARCAAYSPFAYFRLLSSEYDRDIYKFGEEPYGSMIKLSLGEDQSAPCIITMPEMASYQVDGEDYLFHAAYIEVGTALTNLLNIDTGFNIELTRLYEMGVVKIRDNLWMEALNDGEAPPEELGDYWWNQPNLVEMQKMLAKPDGFATWVSSIGADNLTYYSYLRHSDGMEVLYTCSLFKGRKRLVSFTLSPFDVNGGARWMGELQDMLRKSVSDDFTVYHAGEKEDNWDLAIPERLECHDLFAFAPRPPLMPAKGYSVGAVIFETDNERKGLSNDAFVTPKPLSSFTDIMSPNQIDVDGVVLPPLKLPMVEVDTQRGKILYIDFAYINDVIQQALEHDVALSDHESLYKWFVLETGLLEEGTACANGSIVILDMQKDEFYNYATSHLSFANQHGVTQDWIAKYNALFPGLNARAPRFAPFLNMEA